MERVIKPEWLDALPADNPRAQRSRADLRRLNGFMNNAGIVAHALNGIPNPKRVMDVGAGDGTFALRLAEKCKWRGTEFLLVDRLAEVSSTTRDRFHALNCGLELKQCDALAGLDQIGNVDVAVVNLFLHHFAEAELKPLLADIASRCEIFVASEPRRSPLALLASQCVGLIGCNAVTRHDAVISVRAGFANDELSRLWPAASEWQLSEAPAGLFSHLFVAQRR
ncbi:MAG TPA: methyltransferase domain-containing protein [Candidatus Limnocylindria bacterium]|nr:methyltransferase domain-containing protein [Candidatus Limnocylindria bacterium]